MRSPEHAYDYDVAVIGAGPVGCVAALALARRGRTVLLLEANPRSSRRLAGEWLHPPAVRILRELGVDPTRDLPYPSGRGFVVYPDDGSGPVVLPYGSGGAGFSGEHGLLVESLRERCAATEGIAYVERARATRIDGQRLTVHGAQDDERTFAVRQIVGASGRASVAHEALGVRRSVGTYSRMAGVALEDAALPHEGFGHVFLGGLGPVLAYRIDTRRIRLCLDVPLTFRVGADVRARLLDGYAHALPEGLRAAFRDALGSGTLAWAANQIRPRLEFGRDGLALVGDAVGYHHPLTAQGMTLGFQDAVALARSTSFAAYRRERLLRSRVPEMLAVGLYEVFADTSDEVVVIRNAIYQLWRRSPRERGRTMRFLGCQDTGPVAFGSSFLKTLGLAARELVRQGRASGRWGEIAGLGGELSSRIRWLLGGALHLTAPTPTRASLRLGGRSRSGDTLSAEEQYGAALRASSAKAPVVELAASRRGARILDEPRPEVALERAVDRLVALQAADGSWEGEVVWGPLLAAQYVIACHLLGRPIDPSRTRRLLLQFERTRLPGGAWGIDEFLSEPYLFATSLVYVAARLLGVGPGDPLLARALAFIRDEGGVVAVPSWGKFWLAMAGLYEWGGVNPIPAAAWRLPRWIPAHPSRLYCHTRLIYLAMASIYANRFQAPASPIREELRNELYPQGYRRTDFRRARTTLRRAELVSAPGRPLRALYGGLVWAGRLTPARARRVAAAHLRDHVRFELASTRFTSISPVSGLLNAIALHVADASDPDVERALRGLEEWIWEDDVRGTRVAGARSASWDTALALQALAALDPGVEGRRAAAKADGFLAGEQIVVGWPDGRRFHRTDPRGGYCFSRARHGWPVSDCTAEALLGRLASTPRSVGPDETARALAFILRCRNGDGGFGAYEPRRSRSSLEWMNPAELFADSMTEPSFVECTASCIAAISRAVDTMPSLREREDLRGLDDAVSGGVRYLRDAQHRSGSWPGAWGVRLIYGTMFGIRGLTGAGVPPTDPAIRKACAWLKSVQRDDGSWAERHAGAGSAGAGGAAHDPSEYLPGETGQVTQTAWALAALLEARDGDWDAIERGARFLAGAQRSDGSWPAENPAGIFFRTALLDYALYKSYFPVRALGLYESRRRERDRDSGTAVRSGSALR